MHTAELLNCGQTISGTACCCLLHASLLSTSVRVNSSQRISSLYVSVGVCVIGLYRRPTDSCSSCFAAVGAGHSPCRPIRAKPPFLPVRKASKMHYVSMHSSKSICIQCLCCIFIHCIFCTLFYILGRTHLGIIQQAFPV